MNFKDSVTDFVLIAPIVLVASLVVAYLYSLIVHGTGVLDWESSIRFAVVFGIALPLIRQLDKKRAKN